MGPPPMAGAIALLWGLVALAGARAQLSPDYYAGNCPADVVSRIVSDVVGSAFSDDKRIAAGLLRIHFHDCFVSGCDASVLLDGPGSEKGAPPNKGSLQEKAFSVVDDVKAALESTCPGVVSCADILALAAMVSVRLSGGPSWTVMLGRKDSLQAYSTGAGNLPNPTEGLDGLKKKFADVGLDDTDFVALQGAHTIGRARCSSINSRLSGMGQPGPPLDPAYLAALQQQCPPPPAVSDNDLRHDLRLFLDKNTPDVFDNSYYANLIKSQGLLQSDQSLYTPPADTMGIVQQFAARPDIFFDRFARAMDKMGNIPPRAGEVGEIRRVCNAMN